ncbi:MAG: [FeFe] hydrogenase H-cluster radical SAM maturase HydG [Candidatus Wallbacteria bacterium]|nr:[FeFe] hydrogenase H-cluster radical SAM maturase HydG [Candidatus Wallbacteria bacterium]
MTSFIPEKELFDLLEVSAGKSDGVAAAILDKAVEGNGLTPAEAAVLLTNGNETVSRRLFETARRLKAKVYGNRIVLFAPLYVSNECVNECLYCGFRCSNIELSRRTLTDNELDGEVRILEDQGHKRILLVYGEHPELRAEWLVRTIENVYSTKSGKSGSIRRVNVNAAPMEVEDFRIVKQAGIGTYQCFQETYHTGAYAAMHRSGRKSDYLYRLYALDRALEAGIDDVATGVLFGLFDWRFEVLALLFHALHLEERYGVGPHTISFPRIEPALGSGVSFAPPAPVSDPDFLRLIAILRVSVPYTGLILSTRETPEMRRHALKLGVSQISAGSRTYPGGYRDMQSNMPDKQQFTIGDDRSLDEVIRDLLHEGYIPSFCTSCYRVGRTGGSFMEITKRGHIHEFCSPNAILTLNEYLLDYASSETQLPGKVMIEREMNKIAEPMRSKINERLRAMEEQQARDQYF